MASSNGKAKPAAQIVEDGFKQKEGGSFEVGAVTVQPRGNRVDIVPTQPIEPSPIVEVATDGSTHP